MKNIKSLENFTNDKQKSKDTQTTNVAKTKARPRNFDEFFVESIKKEGINGEMRFLTSRDNWISESKARKVLDKIPVEDLEEVEELGEDSPVGSYITSSTVTKVYGDELGDVVNDLTEKSALVYYWDGNITLWSKKDDGLCRIK